MNDTRYIQASLHSSKLIAIALPFDYDSYKRRISCVRRCRVDFILLSPVAMAANDYYYYFPSRLSLYDNRRWDERRTDHAIKSNAAHRGKNWDPQLGCGGRREGKFDEARLLYVFWWYFNQRGFCILFRSSTIIWVSANCIVASLSHKWVRRCHRLGWVACERCVAAQAQQWRTVSVSRHPLQRCKWLSDGYFIMFLLRCGRRALNAHLIHQCQRIFTPSTHRQS